MEMQGRGMNIRREMSKCKYWKGSTLDVLRGSQKEEGKLLPGHGGF